MDIRFNAKNQSTLDFNSNSNFNLCNLLGADDNLFYSMGENSQYTSIRDLSISDLKEDAKIHFIETMETYFKGSPSTKITLTNMSQVDFEVAQEVIRTMYPEYDCKVEGGNIVLTLKDLDKFYGKDIGALMKMSPEARIEKVVNDVISSLAMSEGNSPMDIAIPFMIEEDEQQKILEKIQEKCPGAKLVETNFDITGQNGKIVIRACPSDLQIDDTKREEIKKIQLQKEIDMTDVM